jgi:hypothetical protein
LVYLFNKQEPLPGARLLAAVEKFISFGFERPPKRLSHGIDRAIVGKLINYFFEWFA